MRRECCIGGIGSAAKYEVRPAYPARAANRPCHGGHEEAYALNRRKVLVIEFGDRNSCGTCSTNIIVRRSVAVSTRQFHVEPETEEVIHCLRIP